MEYNKNELKKINLKYFPYILSLLSLIGFAAAFLLTTEKIELLKNNAYVPPCNINPIISCGSVMKTWQASVFGFPNSLLGIAGFAIVLTIGMALIAGAKFKRWFWIGLEAGVVFGICFVHWLFIQSVFVIGALCPYCMVVWSVTIPIFLYVTIYNIQEKHILLPHSITKVLRYLFRYHASFLLLWYLAIFVTILYRFWYYWSTLI